jgi:aerobic carbon-monoxide dehydrogenase medium subunit
MTIARPDGTRRIVPAKDFFKGIFTTVLEKGEILEKICFPIPPKGYRHAYEKLTMGHGDFPIVVVSTVLCMSNDKCTEARIALGGVSDRAIRIRRAEEVLEGKLPSTDDFDKSASIAEEESKPEADLDVSAEYKKKMVRVLVRRALTKAMAKSGAN